MYRPSADQMRMPIVAAECQATRRGSAVEIVDPDIRLALDGDVRNALPVWRYPRCLKRARRELQDIHLAALVGHDEVRDAPAPTTALPDLECRRENRCVTLRTVRRRSRFERRPQGSASEGRSAPVLTD